MKKELFLFSIISALCISSLHAQWTQIAYITSGTDTARSVYQIKGVGNSLYTCTDKGLFVSADNGDSWTSLTYTKTNTANRAIRSVYSDSASGKLYAGGDSTLFVSSDNGGTWSATALTGVDISHIGSKLLASVGAFSRGGVYYSTSGFSTFTQATDTMPKGDFLIDGSNTFVAGKNGIYKSTDNGDTWTVAGTGYPASCKFLTLVRSGTTYYAGDLFGSGLYISSDNGATWANRDSATFHDFCQVFSTTEANGTILCTVDGACNGNEPLKASIDNGATFPGFMSGLSPAYFSIVGRNASGSCFFTFSSNSHQLFRICTLTGIPDEQTTSDMWLSPNPAHAALTVHITDNQPSHISIISITGQIVYESNSPGTGKSQVDVSTLPAGVYMVEVKSQSSRRILKFIKD
jgi:photosystem II stability/assembly factor-like uncharacterized protein